ESLLANALRRAIRIREKEVVPRVSDLPYVIPTLTGKVEFETVEEGKEEQIVDKLIQGAVVAVFNRHFNVVDLEEIVTQFKAGISVEVSDTLPSKEYVKIVKQVEGLGEAVAKLDVGPEDVVIGITASRVAEHFHRPAVLLTTDSNGEAKGSARSIKGVSIYDALAACSDLLTRFGGHDFAAGLALPIENIPLLRDRLQSAIADVVDEDMLTPAIELDAHLDLSAIDDRFWRILNQFSPFGPDNPRPTFFGRDLKVLGQPAAVGPDKRHLKLRVAQQNGSPSYSVIGFGLGDQLDTALQSVRRGVPIELAFTVEENTWNGRTSLQLRAKDIRLEDA
ncbi:MAG: hypothetical protein IIC18_11640, partial [Bacteroidetes bacterium]|nr:hypothetical protein [Bacteroidota bacterium]